MNTISHKHKSATLSLNTDVCRQITIIITRNTIYYLVTEQMLLELTGEFRYLIKEQVRSWVSCLRMPIGRLLCH